MMNNNNGDSKWTLERGLIKSIKQADDGRGQCSASYIEVLGDATTHIVFGVQHTSIGRAEHALSAFTKDVFSIGDYAGRVTQEEMANEADAAYADLMYAQDQHELMAYEQGLY